MVLADGRVVHAVRVALSFSFPLKLAVDKRRCRVLHDAIVWPRQDKVSGEEAEVDQVASPVLEAQIDQKSEKTNVHVSLVLHHHVKIKAERRKTPDILCLLLLIQQTQKVEFSPRYVEVSLSTYTTVLKIKADASIGRHNVNVRSSRTRQCGKILEENVITTVHPSEKPLRV